MAAGEYVSVSSQSDTEHADLAREKRELADDPVFEREELARIYVARGVEAGLAREVAKQLMVKDALGAHARDELGISEISTARPVQAALASAATFSVGAAAPLVLVLVSPSNALIPAVAVGSLFFLALLGANGAGKTSTLMSLIGLVSRKAGRIMMDGEDISSLPIEARIGKGLAIVPEGRRIFPDLSVEENLIVGGHIVSRDVLREGIEQVYGYFPRLRERSTQAAGSLSGGEQQMLAMGRALISRPKVLIVDELSLGLMPKVVDECYAVLKTLKAAGIAIILVEQNTERAMNVADDVRVLEAGNQIWSGSAKEASTNSELSDRLLGLH
ncbi:high-affinity branched-chain amino acid transport ATP-binding protein LivF [mine drainage metagenome]|uniref:High-affinity branched-chain amino acid transport ATP-binding protein LivF n=1 Tax=mine drainage metagenome TaxID=410659 RepID=A0A1J5P214_9ZZZZ